ncbi:hypothetical protein BV898_02119 [Hypsibius exemplaris]|uniref:Uncharacterized protein n=1 Tax=Hypsibius exemplaris TaxID=2072580 RepID=A0A1W0X9F6_HYPEX|nr:hypothetical protein BV898_02119 [Hypsibius exemplaris]
MEKKPKYRRLGRFQSRVLRARQSDKSLTAHQPLLALTAQIDYTLQSEDDPVIDPHGDHDHPFQQIQDSCLHEMLNPKPVSPKTARLFTGECENRMGWRAAEVYAIILYTAKKFGVADTTLGKFLEVIALMVNTPRHPLDQTPVPNSVYKLKSFLGIIPTAHQEVVYICPNRPPAPRKAGMLERVHDCCGYRMRSTADPFVFECPLCKITYDKNVLDRDGNHFITVPLRAIISDTMARFGKYTSLNNDSLKDGSVMNDVVDGQRFRDMDLGRTDLAILKHYDGGVFSKSTQKKLYLSFVQCANIPLRHRLPTWSLHMVWCGTDLPKDRECFIIEDTKQLKAVQSEHPGYSPVVWTDSTGATVSSSVYVHSVLADSPERSALNGQLGHTAAQGCVYCEQVAETIGHRSCFKYDPDTPMKCHDTIMKMVELYRSSTPSERAALLKAHSSHGFKRPSYMIDWTKFDIIKGFSIDVMHQLDEGVARFLLEFLMDCTSVLYENKTQRESLAIQAEMNRLWMSIRVTGNNNREVRPLTTYKTWKAHEYRFFIQHGAPFVLKGAIEEKFYKVYCLTSRIAYNCTKDSISSADVAVLRTLCERFMRSFQSAFGVQEMKYSVHLVTHLWYAVALNGPLHIVSCYGPEDQIGQITRKALGMNNTTKNIMNNTVILTECEARLECLRMDDQSTDQRVVGAIRKALGIRSGVFTTRGLEGSCEMLGKAESSSCAKVLARLSGFFPGILPTQVLAFQRAHLQSGIYVRTLRKNATTKRSESLVLDKQVQSLLASTSDGRVCIGNSANPSRSQNFPVFDKHGMELSFLNGMRSLNGGFIDFRPYVHWTMAVDKLT